MLIDTHKAIEKLIAVGNKKENAEAIVEIINSRDDNLATKKDISILQSELKNVEMSLRSEINTVKWMVGLVCALIIMMISFILSGKF